FTAREYYVSGLGSDDAQGSENIVDGQTSLNFRIWGRHALGIQYDAAWRDANYADIPDKHEHVGTISIVYSYLTDTKFGAVEWRAGHQKRNRGKAPAPRKRGADESGWASEVASRLLLRAL